MKINKIADFNLALGGDFIWKTIKEVTNIKQSRPKSLEMVSGTVAPRICANDCDLVRRIAVNLVTREVRSVHVSSGEWIIANSGQENAVQGIPEGFVLVDVEWNDYYRYMSVTVTSPNLKPQVGG
jgi:hypothetical protein